MTFVILLLLGTMHDGFHRVGTFPRSRLRLKLRCDASPSSAALGTLHHLCPWSVLVCAVPRKRQQWECI